MSRYRPEVWGIGLSSAGFAVAEPGPAGAARPLKSSPWFNAAAAAGSSPEWGERLQRLPVAADQGARVSVTVASDLVRWWTADTPPGTASLKELRQYAALRFEKMFNEAANDWAVVGDWSAHGASVCCAVPAALVRGLEKTAADRGWRAMNVATAASRLRARCAPALEPRHEPWVWATILLDRATLWWHRRGETFKVCTIGVDGMEPWTRIAQEIRRVGSLWPDGAQVEDLHWIAGTPVPVPAAPGWRCVWRESGQPWHVSEAAQSAATVAAALCVAAGAR